MKNKFNITILFFLATSCTHNSFVQRSPANDVKISDCGVILNMRNLSRKVLDGEQSITNKVELDLLNFFKENLHQKLWRKIQQKNLIKNVKRVTDKLPQFKINDSRAINLSKQVNKNKLKETLFIIPSNDGEAIRSLQLMQKLKAPYLQVSSQRWGASLENEILNNYVLNKIKKVLVFELPHPETEKLLRQRGIEVIIIDHHSYQNLDRAHKLSAIEQLANYLEIKLDHMDMQLAVNDRSYIPGLKKLNLSSEEIMNIRRFDHISQGITLKEFNILIKKAKEVTLKLKKSMESLL